MVPVSRRCGVLQLTWSGRNRIQRRSFAPPRMRAKSRRMSSEAHLSAEQPRAQAPSRIPQAHVHGGRTRHPRAAAREETQAPVRVRSMAAGFGRLRQRADFLRIAASGRKQVTPGLIVQTARTPPDTGDTNGNVAMRVGFTVTRRVGNAVVRNRARRRLRAVARDTLLDHGQPGHDYVLIGRQTTLTRSFGKLISDLKSALHRLHADRHAQEIRPTWGAQGSE